MFVDRKTQYYENVGSSYMMYNSNAIPIKISVNYFAGINRLTVKFMCRSEDWEWLTVLKNKVGGMTLRDLETYYEATVVKTVWYGWKDKQIDH